MEKKLLGKTGYRVYPVVFGGIINTNETQRNADQYVSFAVERGVNYFDVAPSYGDAEERLGPALEPHRKGVTLACKTTERGAKKSKEELLSSLKRLRTDHFDVYQLHAMSTPLDVAQAFGPDGAMETLLWAKREGLILKMGFSTHDEDAALKCLDLYPFDSVLFPMNWALGINRGWGERISERAKTDGYGLLAMKTLIHRKYLEGEARAYPKSWCKPISGNEALGVAAMKYGLHKGGAALVPPGNFEHFNFMLDHIEEAVNHPLSGAEWELLRGEAENVKDHLIF